VVIRVHSWLTNFLKGEKHTKIKARNTSLMRLNQIDAAVSKKLYSASVQAKGSTLLQFRTCLVLLGLGIF